MKVVIGFPTLARIIEFEPFLGDDIEEYQKAFENWYYEKIPGIGIIPGTNEFGTIRRQRSDLNYTTLDANVVIDWIKEVAPEANPVIVVEKINPKDVDPTLPGMYF